MASIVDRHGIQRDAPPHMLDPSDAVTARATIIRALYQSGWSISQIAGIFERSRMWTAHQLWGGRSANALSKKVADG